MLVGPWLSSPSLCPAQGVIVVFLCAMQCGWLLAGLARASRSPEARTFTAVQAGLGVHATAKVSIALLGFQDASLEEVLKDQAGEFCSCAARIGE